MMNNYLCVIRMVAKLLKFQIMTLIILSLLDFSWTGVRDDLCALHCELRNTEQLLSSLGLTAHRCRSLKECNKVLAE